MVKGLLMWSEPSVKALGREKSENQKFKVTLNFILSLMQTQDLYVRP